MRYDDDVLLDELLDVEFGLSEWEVSFIEKMFVFKRGGGALSSKQLSKLHEIWEKAQKLKDAGETEDHS